ncbi:hypothetical protein D7V86_04045 [bacterium D16-51]|nr:hypothetical protein D7V96_19115 [bacterium D16-59]RKI61705.1 hypothetical protein D7V86_04045 [bacterium D16-51]
MKTLYIHIGTPKTGSSAIQSFLWQNRKVLEQKGYCYPDVSFRYEFVSKRRNGYFLRAEDLGNKGSGFEEGMDIIREAFEEYPNVILSDEGIWYEGVKWHKKLLKIMQKKGYQVKLVVYLRRQDEYLISRWNQYVKTAASKYKDTEKDLNEWETFLQKGLKDFTMNYGENLKRLEEIYGRQNIFVRRYDRKYFPDNSICADFLQTIGLAQTEEYTMAQMLVNPSLSQNTAEIQRVLNTLIEKNEDGDSDDDSDLQFFRNLLLSFSELSTKSYPCSMFSEEEAKEFMEHYHEGNCRVAKEYFGEEELFHLEEGKAKPKWEKNNPNMQDDMIRFMGASCMYFLEENRRINKELQELKLFKNKMRHPIHTLSKKLSNRE